MNTLKISLALLLFCLVGATISLSQDKSSKKDKTAMQPVEIKANVLVLDPKGNFVDEIKAGDLKVFEDGVEQKITYFAKKESILNLGLLIDNTGSLRSQFNDLLNIGAVLASNLSKEDEAFLVRFASNNRVELLQDWTSNRSLLQKGLSNMYIEGGASAIIDALYTSAEKILERERKDKSKRYAIIQISDFEERSSYYNLQQMLSLVEKTEIQVFPIALTSELSNKRNPYTNLKNSKTNSEKLARTLALETGGTAFVLSERYKREDLINMIKSLLSELRSQYVIGYTPTNQKRDGLPRKLSVQVADGEKSEKRLGFIREGFIVPKD